MIAKIHRFLILFFGFLCWCLQQATLNTSSLKLTASLHLKMDDWKTAVVYLVSFFVVILAYFQRRLHSFRECSCCLSLKWGEPFSFGNLLTFLIGMGNSSDKKSDTFHWRPRVVKCILSGHMIFALPWLSEENLEIWDALNFLVDAQPSILLLICTSIKIGKKVIQCSFAHHEQVPSSCQTPSKLAHSWLVNRGYQLLTTHIPQKWS